MNRGLRKTAGNRAGHGALLFSAEARHKMGRPANADEKTVRPVHADFIKSPFAVSQDTARANDQVIHACGNHVHFWRPDEDPEGIMSFRYSPRASPGLGQMHLASPAGHYGVVLVSAGPGEAQTLPEWNCRPQVVTRDDGECANVCRDGHASSLARRTARFGRCPTVTARSEACNGSLADTLTRKFG